MMQYIIFDIDGVLADHRHRLGFILQEPKDHDAFFDACDQDSPRFAEIQLLQLLYWWPGLSIQIVLLTGRSSRIEAKTREWLAANAVPFDWLCMRKEGDHRPDYVTKPQLLADFLQEHHPGEILCIFEDRSAVVREWRKRGYLCFQNTEGDL